MARKGNVHPEPRRRRVTSRCAVTLPIPLRPLTIRQCVKISFIEKGNHFLLYFCVRLSPSLYLIVHVLHLSFLFLSAAIKAFHLQCDECDCPKINGVYKVKARKCLQRTLSL